MSFYLPPRGVLAEALSRRGGHRLRINSRGHDWICRTGNLTKPGGSAYEERIQFYRPGLCGARIKI